MYLENDKANDISDLIQFIAMELISGFLVIYFPTRLTFAVDEKTHFSFDKLSSGHLFEIRKEKKIRYSEWNLTVAKGKTQAEINNRLSRLFSHKSV